MNLKKVLVIKLKIVSNILFSYSILQDRKDMVVTIKKLYLKDENGENFHFLNKDYQLTTEKEEF
jgi:hypothetical protein